jgi:TRAP-type C4-dicarboxylate transport system permease small subunit
MAGGLSGALRRVAGIIAGWSLGVVFALFMTGIAARYLFDRPISWIDEAVTLLAVWSTFWTAAFVLDWRDHIAFDIVYCSGSERLQRLFLIVGLTGFSALMLAALPGMVDYTLFQWRETTDAMRLRLDVVYAVFPIFFAVIILRMLIALRRLLGREWRAELSAWSSEAPSEPERHS